MPSIKDEIGELRQDVITQKWVVIATNRAKRPDQFAEEEKEKGEERKNLPKYEPDCPFCNLARFPQEPDVLRLPDDPDKWKVHIFGNKYPAFQPREEFRTWNEGPHLATEAVGYHEILATRHHNELDGLLSLSMMEMEIEALVLRYRELMQKPSVNYIQIIKNYGKEAGGSLVHPHHQIFTVPVLPSDIADLLHGVQRYAKENNQKAYRIILAHEREVGIRIIWENEHFTVFCPYASRVPFETWIMPRESNPFFHALDPNHRTALAEAMQQALGRLYTGLSDPPFNYYIHSAPCDETGFTCDSSIFPNFRWHMEILPRVSQFGGFELGTGLEINSISPEHAAEYLREQKLPTPIS